MMPTILIIKQSTIILNIIRINIIISTNFISILNIVVVVIIVYTGVTFYIYVYSTYVFY